MKEKKRSDDTIANISDELIEEASELKRGKKFSLWSKLTALVVFVVIIIALTLLFPREKNQNTEANINIVYPEAYAYGDFDTLKQVRDQNPIEDEFIKALNEFTYKTSANILTEAGKNINYSPISLYYALSLAASGAEGETEDQLLALLGVSDKECFLNSAETYIAGFTKIIKWENSKLQILYGLTMNLGVNRLYLKMNLLDRQQKTFMPALTGLTLLRMKLQERWPIGYQ